jgi:hypothetical protein
LRESRGQREALTISGRLRVFERRGRDRGASSADAENAKDLWRPRRYTKQEGGEKRPEREG